jgi:hypothetical protein
MLARFVAWLIVLAPLNAVLAQSLPTESLPSPGARLRVVTKSGERMTGTLSAIVVDTLLLDVRVRGAAPLVHRPVAIEQVGELLIGQGRRRTRGAFIGLGIGLLAGVLTGAAVGGALGNAEARRSECSDCAEGFFGAIGGAALGGLLGAPLGAVIGARSAPERWARRWPTK